MTAKELVTCFYEEKKQLFDAYFNATSPHEASTIIKSLSLTKEQEKLLHQLIDMVISDVMYTILLGLEGSASIGSRQEQYTLLDEKGNPLTGGEIEAQAWEYFHTQR